jgi:hypothetical protein
MEAERLDRLIGEASFSSACAKLSDDTGNPSPARLPKAPLREGCATGIDEAAMKCLLAHVKTSLLVRDLVVNLKLCRSP